MARVILSGDLGRRFAGGEVEIRVSGSNVVRLIKALEERYPGIAEVLDSDAMAVAIDGIVYQDALLEEVGPDAEVYFLPAIRGGTDVASGQSYTFVTFNDVMSKLGALIFYWSLLEQQLVLATANLVKGSDKPEAQLSLNVKQRLNAWCTLVSESSRDKADQAAEVVCQALKLGKIRNEIVHGLNAGGAVSNFEEGYIECAVGGHVAQGTKKRRFSLEDMEAITQAIDACRRALISIWTWRGPAVVPEGSVIARPRKKRPS